MNQEEHGHKWTVLRQNTYCLKKSEFIYQSRGIFATATASLRLCKKRGVSQFGNPQPLPSCGFAGAQPRLTQNAAPLAFCRLCRRSLSVQWPASPCFPSLPQARTCAKAHSKIGEFAKANSRNATMWHDLIPHARKLAGGHQTYLWDFISLHLGKS